VAASGTPSPTYQWRKGGVNIVGATSATYTIASTVAGDAGSYSAVATNSAGSATSNAATLNVNAAPVIVTQPVSAGALTGTSVTFTVVATGTPAPTYRWKKGGVNITGATSATYTLTNVTTASAGNYTVTVTNSIGNVTSSIATLTVSATAVAPVITTQPVGLTATAGALVKLTALASGVPTPTYQWQKNGVDLVGATSSTLTFTSVQRSDVGNYRVVATNTGGSATSNAVTLGVAVANKTAAATGDFNGDGLSDMLWYNNATGEKAIWLMDGTMVLANYTLGVLPVEWTPAASGDFNGDGQLDILWQNSLTGQRALWLMNGIGGGFTPANIVNLGWVDPNWLMAGTGDFDGDGQADILWQNAVTGQRALWLMNGIGGGFTPASIVNLGYVDTNWVMAN